MFKQNNMLDFIFLLKDTLCDPKIKEPLCYEGINKLSIQHVLSAKVLMSLLTIIFFELRKLKIILYFGVKLK